MTKKELAENYMYELYNDSDHVASLVRCARSELESGDFAEALSFLRLAQSRPAALLDMRLRDAINSIEEAAKEGAA